MLIFALAAGATFGSVLSALAAAPAPRPAAAAQDTTQAIDAAVKQALARCEDLLAKGKTHEAYPILLQARQACGEPRNPRIETLLAKVALAEKAPDKALEFVAPYADMKDFHDRLAEAYLTAGDAYLAAGRNRDALAIFDWMAAKAGGLPLVLAAEGCGKALMSLKDHAKAVEALDFAVRYAKSKCYDEVALIKRIESLLAKARRLADIELYGEDFVLYRDAEHLRREKGDFKRARPIYEEVIQRFPDGVYADASRLYGAMCLVEMNKVAEAQKELAAIRAADPYGLYAGEALLELGKIALVHHLQPQAAKGCFLLLDTWLREAKDKPPLNIDKLVVRDAAKKVTTPPVQEKYVDYWGNVKKSEIKPGQLVNRSTCPWYQDDLAEQCAMYLGFIAFADGRKEEAMAWYQKILECDPAARRMEKSGEWNDYSRLKWGVEHGYLYAYPQELDLYKDPRQRLAVMLVDLFYCIERNEDGIALCGRILKGAAVPMNNAQRDYVWFALGSCLQRAGRYGEALDAFEKVLQTRNGTFTERRAALAAGQLAVLSSDRIVNERGQGYLRSLASSSSVAPYQFMAMIAIGRNLIDRGLREEGLAWLKRVPEDAGAQWQIADFLIRMYTGQEPEDHK